jgi:hypothetical protein
MSNFIETFQVICEMIYNHKDVASVVVINEVVVVRNQTTACDDSPREQETAQEEVQAYEEKRPWLGTDDMPGGRFQKMFRLDRETFEEARLKVTPRIRKRDELQAIRSAGSSIHIKTKLAVTLRWLAGGMSYLDLCFAFDISTASFYEENGC